MNFENKSASVYDIALFTSNYIEMMWLFRQKRQRGKKKCWKWRKGKSVHPNYKEGNKIGTQLVQIT